jgi:hypothetical protein
MTPQPEHGVDPKDWLPRAVEYLVTPRHRLCVDRAWVTWPELVRARDTCQYDMQRAFVRRWHRAFRQHMARLRRLERVLEVFAPVMQDHPTRTFGEACAHFSRQALKVVKEL